MKPINLDQELARRLLDEYCWFWSVEMRSRNESASTLEHAEISGHALSVEFSSSCKLLQSTIADMNHSLLGE